MVVQKTLPGIEIAPSFTTVAGVRAWANKNYEIGGAAIIEEWTDDDIEEILMSCKDGRDARRRFINIIKDYFNGR